MGCKAVSILFYGISVVLTGLLLVAAVLCRYASSVSPGEGGFWATLALLMPVVLLANVVALVWWTVRRKWIVLLMPTGRAGAQPGVYFGHGTASRFQGLG